MGQRDVGIGIGDGGIGRGREQFAGHAGKGIENGLIEHVPGANLLGDHLLASGFKIHGIHRELRRGSDNPIAYGAAAAAASRLRFSRTVLPRANPSRIA